MEEQWIILHAQDAKFPIYDVDELAVIDDDGSILVFNSLDEASNYQEKHTISGQCIQIPTF